MPDEHRSPDWTIDLRSRLTDLRVADTRIDDIVEELSQHLDDRYDELVESGVPDGVARRSVLDELAAPHVLRRALAPLAVPVPAAAPILGQVHTGSWLAGLTTDVRDGIRALRGSPATTIVALLTLAIGIGASVAIFSVVNAAIMRPLPFARPNEIVSFWGSAPEMGLPVVNYPDAVYDYFRKRSYTMQPIAAYTSGTLTLSGTGEPERLRGAFVTAEFFRLFGRAPQIGRDFLPEEEAHHRNRVAVISDGLWRRRFGARPDVIGQSLTLDGLSITVIGVMARGFDFPDRAEMWLPIPTDPQATSCWCYGTIGRLTEGQTSGSAAREIAWLTDDFWRERDKKPVEDRTSGNPKAIVVTSPLARELTGDVRTPLFVLMGAVGLVLLIACANIANLLLARAGARTREIAMRCCLGASMWRIVRQLLVESLLLGIAGAALGMIVAVWGAQALGRLIVERLPHVNNVPLDPAVLLFALGVTLITVVLFGVAPAVRGARVDLQTAVKDGVRSSRGAASRRLTNAFVVAQLALSIVLLVGAVLLLRSLGNLLAIDPGFRSDNVLVGRVTLALNDRPEAEANQYVRAFYVQLADRLRALPGVSHVGLSSTAPFSAGNNQQIFSLKGHEPAPGQPKLVASVRGVTPGYFAAIGTPLQLGRLLDASDTERAPLVAIVDETLARRFWPDGNAVGQEVRLGDDGPWRRIVGVVASVKHGDLSHDSDRYVYLPHAQLPTAQMDIVVRAHVEPTSLTASIRREVLAMNAAMPLYDVHTLEGAVAESLGARRLTNDLLLAFAIAALVLAAVGVYGVMTLDVGQRVHEFGIRLALGATTRDVLSLVVGQGMRLVIAGVVLGLAAALALTRYLDALLFGVRPTDPLAFTAVPCVLVIVALAACLIPARRATSTPPVEALRSQ